MLLLGLQVPISLVWLFGFKDLHAKLLRQTKIVHKTVKQPIIFQLILARGSLMLCFLVYITLRIAASPDGREEQKG